jgi:hypothetical protein
MLFEPHMLNVILADLAQVWEGLVTETPAELPANTYNVAYEL